MIAFTALDGNIFYVNPDQVGEVHQDPVNAARSYIRLTDGTLLLLAQTAAVTLRQLERKYASIATTASGNNTIVAAVVGKRIRVTGYMIGTDSGGGGTDIQWRSSPAGAFLTGPIHIDKSAVIPYPGTISGPALETAVGEALVLYLSAAKNISGHVTYLEV